MLTFGVDPTCMGECEWLKVATDLLKKEAQTVEICKDVCTQPRVWMSDEYFTLYGTITSTLNFRLCFGDDAKENVI